VTESAFDSPPCPVCGADDTDPIRQIVYGSSAVLETLGVSERPQVAILRCRRCDHRFARPQITATALAVYYRDLGSDFYSEPANDSAEAARARIFTGAIERWKRGGRILDIGCGRGKALRALSPLRWERIGIDPSPTVDIEEAASDGVTIIRGFLDDVSLPAGYFDVVVAFDLLEHLRDARTAVKRMRDLIRDDGIAAIVTGDISSFFARMSGGRWGYFGSWEHVSFFTPSSARYLFESAGFEIVETRRISHDQRIKSIADVLRLAAPIAVKNSVKRVLNAMRVGGPYEIRKYPLLFDHMLVIAKATREPRQERRLGARKRIEDENRSGFNTPGAR
jgi:SAM-dependent methyltransferase